MLPLFRGLEVKISLGRGLLEKLSTQKLKNVQGVAKLEKKVLGFTIQSIAIIFVSKVRQEVKFLEKFEAAEKFKKLKKEHISCSNLSHQVNHCVGESCLAAKMSKILAK